ncbi:MAG: hypothetical protein QW050_01765 [Candidatus Nitrosocaldaceae archaeon]
MPAKGWKTLTITEELYKRLHNRWKEENKPMIPFTPWVSQYILENLEEDEMLLRYSPGLEFISITGNVVDIADRFIDRIVEVEIHDQGIGKRFLYCRYCERDDCLHVGFAFAIREVNKVLVERGFKQPKVK